MKHVRLLGSLALAAALAAPLGTIPVASAATTTQLTVVDAYSYSSGHPFDHTVCLDGQSLTSLSTEQHTGPFTVATGAHTVAVISSAGADCATAQPDLTTSVTLNGPADTLAIWWPFDSGIDVAVFPDDTSCITAGQSRLVFRNVTGDDVSSSDLVGSLNGAASAAVISSVSRPDQGSLAVTAGSLTSATVNESGTANVEATIGTVALPDSQAVTVYAYAGVDGSVGAFAVTSPANPCQVVTTTTVAPTTTTIAPAPTTIAPAPAAQPVVTQPTYTG